MERYDQLRTALRALNLRITETLAKRALEETAKSLRVWSAAERLTQDEVALAVLNDCAIHDYQVGGKSAVARFASRPGLTLTPDERVVLDALVKARPTVIKVREPVSKERTVAFDTLAGKDLVISDRGLAEVGEEGDTMSLRLFEVEDLIMTTGAPAAFSSQIADIFATAAPLPESAWNAKGRAAMGLAINRLALAEDDDVAKLVATMSTQGQDPISIALRTKAAR